VEDMEINIANNRNKYYMRL